MNLIDWLEGMPITTCKTQPCIYCSALISAAERPYTRPNLCATWIATIHMQQCPGFKKEQFVIIATKEQLNKTQQKYTLSTAPQQNKL